MQSEAASAAATFAAGGALTGLLHASGLLHDALIAQQSAALVREVFAAKAAHHLLNVRSPLPCRLFCLSWFRACVMGFNPKWSKPQTLNG